MEYQNKRSLTVPQIREVVEFGSIYFVIALINLRVKLSLTPAWFDGTLKRNHEQLLALQYANNEQSRLLQFLIPEGLKQLLGLSTTNAYILQRWLFIFLAFLCFHFYLKRWFDAKGAFAGVLFLAAILPLSYWIDLQESTPLLLLTFLLGLWAIREHHTAWYMLVMTLGVLNNETVLILPLAFFLYNFKGIRPKPLIQLALRTLASSLPAYVLYGTIRYITRDSPRLAPLWQWDGNMRGILKQISAFPLDYWNATFLFVFFIFGVFWLFAFLGYPRKPLFLQRTALMIPFFIAAHLLAGMINEVRLMLPLSFIIIPMALFYLFPMKQEEQ
jgi:hypothetical protein